MALVNMDDDQRGDGAEHRAGKRLVQGAPWPTLPVWWRNQLTGLHLNIDGTTVYAVQGRQHEQPAGGVPVAMGSSGRAPLTVLLQLSTTWSRP